MLAKDPDSHFCLLVTITFKLKKQCCKITFITVKLALPLFDGHLKNLLKSFTKAMTLDVVPTKSPSEAVILLYKKVNWLVAVFVILLASWVTVTTWVISAGGACAFPSAKNLQSMTYSISETSFCHYAVRRVLGTHNLSGCVQKSNELQ